MKVHEESVNIEDTSAPSTSTEEFPYEPRRESKIVAINTNRA